MAAVPELSALAYAGAVDVALYASERQRFADARVAWATVVRILQTQPSPNALMLARAQLGLATAGIAELDSDRWPGLAVQHRYEEYDDLLLRTAAALAQEARKPSPDASLTAAQSLYAQAMAWHSLYRTEPSPGAPPRPGKDAFVEEIGATRYDRPACAGKLEGRPPEFPRKERTESDVGTVMLKVRVNEDGAIEHWLVAASIGGGHFVKSVTDVLSTWRFQKKDPSEANCRVAREVLFDYVYTYR